MKKIVGFYKNITLISLTIAVAEAAIGWKFHGAPGVVASLFFVGLALGSFIVSVHLTDMDDKIRQGFLDHLNVIEPRLMDVDEELALEAHDIRQAILSDGLLVQISHRFGALNSKMLERGLMLSAPVVTSAHI